MYCFFGGKITNERKMKGKLLFKTLTFDVIISSL